MTQWIPFNLDDLEPDDFLPLSDPDSFIPFLTQRWPTGGRPHRVELSRDGRANPAAWMDTWCFVYRRRNQVRPRAGGG